MVSVIQAPSLPTVGSASIATAIGAGLAAGAGLIFTLPLGLIAVLGALIGLSSYGLYRGLTDPETQLSFFRSMVPTFFATVLGTTLSVGAPLLNFSLFWAVTVPTGLGALALTLAGVMIWRRDPAAPISQFWRRLALSSISFSFATLTSGLASIWPMLSVTRPLSALVSTGIGVLGADQRNAPDNGNDPHSAHASPVPSEPAAPNAPSNRNTPSPHLTLSPIESPVRRESPQQTVVSTPPPFDPTSPQVQRLLTEQEQRLTEGFNASMTAKLAEAQAQYTQEESTLNAQLVALRQTATTVTTRLGVEEAKVLRLQETIKANESRILALGKAQVDAEQESQRLTTANKALHSKIHSLEAEVSALRASAEAVQSSTATIHEEITELLHDAQSTATVQNATEVSLRNAYIASVSAVRGSPDSPKTPHKTTTANTHTPATTTPKIWPKPTYSAMYSQGPTPTLLMLSPDTLQQHRSDLTPSPASTPRGIKTTVYAAGTTMPQAPNTPKPGHTNLHHHKPAGPETAASSPHNPFTPGRAAAAAAAASPTKGTPPAVKPRLHRTPSPPTKTNTTADSPAASSTGAARPT